ncbi:MAG: hypothetical protein ACK4R7_04075 [Fervidobacterium sp.]
MRKKALLITVILTAVLLAILTSCTGLFEKPLLSEVSDPTNVPEDDPAYALAVLTDPDYEQVVKPMSEKSLEVLSKLSEQVMAKGTVDVNTVKLLEDDSDAVAQLEEVVNTVETNKDKEIISKLRKYLQAYRRIERLQNKYEYKVRLAGQLLERLRVKFGITDSTAEVYFDYENATVLAIHANIIIVVHDNLSLFKKIIHILKTTPYTEQGSAKLENLKAAFETAKATNLDSDWQAVQIAAEELASLEEPDDFINSKDVLNEQYTTITNLKTIISGLDSLVSKLVSLYEYEKNYLNENGERKDGKIRLRLRFEIGSSTGVKAWLDLDVAISIPVFTANIPADIYVNDQKITKLIDFLKLLDQILPNGVLNFVMRPSNSLLNNFEFSGYFNFGKLNVDSFDLRNNNIGLKSALFAYAEEDDENGLRYYIVNDDPAGLLKFIAVNNYAPFIRYSEADKLLTVELAFYSDSSLNNKAVSWTLKLKFN